MDDIFSVGGFLLHINDVLKQERCFVQGEVTEVRITPQWGSFTLKDKEENAVLKCVMGAWKFRQLGIALEQGMEVKVGGAPRITPSYGSFGMWVDSVELMGEGALKKAYEDLKKQLDAEGLFKRKRVIPEHIQSIGIISSKGGVVIHDFLKNLAPLGFKIHFLDARVEGAQAVSELVRSINFFNKQMPALDVLVVIRGGGSLESLQAFNNELVCRAFFGSSIPIVAGIGHDVDVPLAALVADAMESTPTAAAVRVNRSWDVLRGKVETAEYTILGRYEAELAALSRRADRAVSVMLGGLRQVFLVLQSLEARFVRGTDRLGFQFREIKLRAEQKLAAMTNTLERLLGRAKETVQRAEQIILIGNPERNLRLGYALLFDEKGKVLKSVKQVKEGAKVKNKLADGEVVSQVVSVVQ